MRHVLAFELQILHIPEVAELVLHARRRTARFGGLHGKTAQQQSFGQLLHLLHVAVVDPFGIAQRLLQTVLHQIERKAVDRLRSHDIGDHPVGAGRNLGDQVGIPRRRHRLGGLGRDPRIEGHAVGRRTVERLLVALIGDRSAVGRITVHRGGRADAHVTTAATVRRQLRQVVDDARAHRHGNSVGLFQHVLQLLDIRPLRERIVVTVYVRFVLCDTGRVEIVLHGFAGQRIGDLVGHDNGPFPGKQLLEHLGRTGQGVAADNQRFGVRRPLQGTFNFVHFL